jgi:hypothetical protein
MFINASLKVSKLKHVVYLIAVTILGVLINYLILCAVQVIYFQQILHSEKNIAWYSGYPPYLIFLSIFLLIGALWGFAFGRYWWRIIYIEHKYRKIIFK